MSKIKKQGETIVSESKKRNYVSESGLRYKTKMVVTLIENGKTSKGKQAFFSSTRFRPVY